MAELVKIESRVWELIEEATRSRDTTRLKALNGVAEQIKKLKDEIEILAETFKDIDNPNPPELEERSPMRRMRVTWRVTNGALRQNYLITTIAKRYGLLPPNGQTFKVKTSVGQEFETDELPGPYNRLRERGKIKEFYEKAGIKAGDEVSWKEIGLREYYLEKV